MLQPDDSKVQVGLGEGDKVEVTGVGGELVLRLELWWTLFTGREEMPLKATATSRWLSSSSCSVGNNRPVQ